MAFWGLFFLFFVFFGPPEFSDFFILVWYLILGNLGEINERNGRIYLKITPEKFEN
jgi:hypothetical protein